MKKLTKMLSLSLTLAMLIGPAGRLRRYRRPCR